MTLTYEEMTSRNAGFISETEQRCLRASSVFVCGVGGMGGAAVHALARVGLGTLAITDPDHFEASNLNRQTFADSAGLGEPKVDVTRAALLRMNPWLEVEVVGEDWSVHLDELLARHRVVVNAMDDVRSGIALYRRAREHGATVIDAYPSPCPSVTVVAPEDLRPEERLGFPTVGVAVDALTEAHLSASFLIEVDYVARQSTGLGRIDRHVVDEILAGRRPRSSFAPTVMIAGNLMAFEAIACILGRESGVGCEGYFFDPWGGRVERPAA
jgi:hypothetical protein